MCGIVLLYGDTAKKNISAKLTKLSHRGPDDRHCWINGQLAIGFVRLTINDNSMAGRQPYNADGVIGAINGEVYNADTLSKHYNLTLKSKCDTHVVVPLFSEIGYQVLAELDGFYSGVIYRYETQTLYLLRDHIGKKPLFYGRADNNLFVVSELKVLQNIEWFEQVPLGISQLELTSGKLTLIAKHPESVPSKYDLATAMEKAVIKRLPKQPIGVFLSGGLDSSIIAALASQYHKNITYFVLGNPDSIDVAMVTKLVNHLGIKRVNYIPLPTEQELPNLIAKIVYVTESYNPSIISNGLATYLLADAAQKEGLKVVLTGEGADELFAGYHGKLSESEWQSTRSNLINDMCFTELRRLDNCSMANSVEARCPFLDRTVKSIADALEHKNFYSNDQNKVVLRNTFRYLLPVEIADRKKTSFDVGSGIRKLVVNYLTRNGDKEIVQLKKIWSQKFTHNAENPYFFSYPTFDRVISKRGETHT
ncbi:asparagine synthase-related protein [Shewanella colwelliana]|uniref:asparagine synthetase B family protein n=1 Tax=Shewanella colwelliana TaxID=23 RepID=UPI00299DEA89|nr:asparagine synthase-related protein [Shewanella colwelliana]MDX1279584.1 asparagine synthase-related protein [Shewanella colwelliana]